MRIFNESVVLYSSFTGVLLERIGVQTVVFF